MAFDIPESSGARGLDDEEDTANPTYEPDELMGSQLDDAPFATQPEVRVYTQ